MDLLSFQQHLNVSRRVLALVGAGLSAGSGLPTFRGPSGHKKLALWNNLDAAELATPEAFELDPQLVWQFYAWRRAMALRAQPNQGHRALARLAQVWASPKSADGPRFLTLTQNVDALSEQAGHPITTLVHLHGELFAVKCTSWPCKFQENNFNPSLGVSTVPKCPRCNSNLRPGVTWFGESLPYTAIVAANEFVETEEVDLVMCIGMSATVWPAAGFIDEVVMRGGKVAVFNCDGATQREGAWFFKGKAEEWLPRALEPIIGSTLEDSGSDLSELSE